jgi:transposase
VQDRRAVVLARLVAGKVTTGEAALLLGRSERSVWRLRAAFLASGPAALVHGNRGRRPTNTLEPATVARVITLARTTYAGCNDSHLAELLAERERIVISRASLQRILRGAGIASPHRHRAPRYRSRRERRAAAGMLLQLDGSRHRWLGAERGWSTLLGAIDDATGEVIAAAFREQEDAAGYLSVLRTVLARRGVPLAVYSDRHGIFWRSARERPSPEEELDGHRQPTQVGRALGELGVEMIFANSPQAKGRIERLWGTFQDRLVSEMRLARVTTLEEANRFLPRYLARHNRRFAVAPVDPSAAWRTLPADLAVEAVCCFKYSKRVAMDNTVRFDQVLLQLPRRAGAGSWANTRVELRQYLDGSLSVHAPGGRVLARSAIPTALPTLRARDYARAPIPGVPALPLQRPPKSHPWRRDYREWHPLAAQQTMQRARRDA